jgi:probable rRNA maturation factor
MSAAPVLPRLKLSIARDDGAPRAPKPAQVRAACAAALAHVPRSRHPEAFARKALSLDVLLVNDERIAELNAQHLHHEGPTDVLSFPMNDDDPARRAFHLGDVVISFETAQREAAERGLPLAEEIVRYCVHGFLHCLGYDDSTPAKRKAMFAIQENAVKNAFLKKTRKPL